MEISEIERDIASAASKSHMGSDFSRIVDALLLGPRKLSIADFERQGGATIEHALSQGIIEVIGPRNAKPKSYQLTEFYRSQLSDLIARATLTLPSEGLLPINYRQQREQLHLLSAEAGMSVRDFKALFIEGIAAFNHASQQQIEAGFLKPFKFMNGEVFIKTAECLRYQNYISKRFDETFTHAKPQRAERAREKRNAVRTRSERLSRYVSGILSAVPVDESSHPTYRRWLLHSLVNRLATLGLSPTEIGRHTGIPIGQVTWALGTDAVCLSGHVVPNPVPEVCALAAQRSFNTMRYFNSILQEIVIRANSKVASPEEPPSSVLV